MMKKRRITEYKMQLAIAQNPHVKDPKEMWKTLDESIEREVVDDKLDVEGMERLKAAMGGGGAFLVK